MAWRWVQTYFGLRHTSASLSPTLKGQPVRQRFDIKEIAMQYVPFIRLRSLWLLFLVMFFVGCSTQKPQPTAPPPVKKDKREYIALAVSPAIGVSEWPGLSANKVRKYSLIPALKQFHKTKRFKFKKPSQQQKTPATLHLRVDLNGRFKTGELFMEIRFEGGESYFITAKTELHGLTDTRVFEALEKLSTNMAKTLISDMRKSGMKI
jgi:hypothetical protein